MTASSKTYNLTCHVRSISLPSKNHPLVAIVGEQLAKLRASSTIAYKLGALRDLCDSVDDLFHLPLTPQALPPLNHEATLDGSLRLLDVCGTTRDIFSQMKECAQERESSLRRKRGGESTMESDVKSYTEARKRLDKVISKCLGNTKRMEKICNAPSSDEDLNLAAVLREADKTSLVVFECLLPYVPSPKTRSRPGGWSRVSKLLKSRQVSSKDPADANEVEKIDVELLGLIGKKSSPAQVQKLLGGLKALHSSVQEMEDEIDCAYRRLLKTRVTVLNILHH